MNSYSDPDKYPDLKKIYTGVSHGSLLGPMCNLLKINDVRQNKRVGIAIFIYF